MTTSTSSTSSSSRCSTGSDDAASSRSGRAVDHARHAYPARVVRSRSAELHPSIIKIYDSETRQSLSGTRKTKLFASSALLQPFPSSVPRATGAHSKAEGVLPAETPCAAPCVDQPQLDITVKGGAAKQSSHIMVAPVGLMGAVREWQPAPLTPALSVVSAAGSSRQRRRRRRSRRLQQTKTPTQDCIPFVDMPLAVEGLLRAALDRYVAEQRTQNAEQRLLTDPPVEGTSNEVTPLSGNRHIEVLQAQPAVVDAGGAFCVASPC